MFGKAALRAESDSVAASQWVTHRSTIAITPHREFLFRGPPLSNYQKPFDFPRASSMLIWQIRPGKTETEAERHGCNEDRCDRAAERGTHIH